MLIAIINKAILSSLPHLPVSPNNPFLGNYFSKATER